MTDVMIRIGSRPVNAPEFALWDDLGVQNLTVQRGFHTVQYMLEHYVGVPSYDALGLSMLIMALHDALKACENTSKLKANYVGRFEEYRLIFEA